MNGNIRRITLGAIYLAIYGALLTIDRTIGSPLSDILPILATAFIVTYSKKLSDCVALSIGLLIIAVLFGSALSYIYTPVNVIVGLIIHQRCFKVKGKQLLRETALVYFILETFVAFCISPLFGITIEQQLKTTIDFFKLIHLPTFVAPLIFLITIGLLAIVETILTYIVINAVNKLKKNYR